MYNMATNAESGGGTIMLDQLAISSIQCHTHFQLHMSMPGHTYYKVKQIAKFKTDNHLSYCLNDILGPKDPASPNGTILLDGTPPFQLKLLIKNLAANKVHVENIEVNDSIWRLNLPSYYFTSVGPYQVMIDSILDLSHCEQAMVDPLHRSIWIDVTKMAAIIPLEKKKDFCVGDIIWFELEDTPP
ncbi:hypothetical protein PISMIDRAFT_637010 [Pisolithus microcarpus 441]|uniref:Unplaced genomic scaffold scaffold_177, whole genome shotgun sequence n=1 Tax=Pisolithus microcarpus 441 TaxID=765257 RepID=A0A0C9Z8V5_9AGAM|nr:hypothetical protein PISMIDRAFT_637010 [Pisolithus microcarpus 441]